MSNPMNVVGWATLIWVCASEKSLLPTAFRPSW